MCSCNGRFGVKSFLSGTDFRGWYVTEYFLSLKSESRGKVEAFFKTTKHGVVQTKPNRTRIFSNAKHHLVKVKLLHSELQNFFGQHPVVE